MALGLEDGEQVIDLLQRALDVIAAQEGAHFQVFLDRHRGEDVLRLRHKGHALGHPGLRGQGGDILTHQPHMARPDAQHPEHRLHRGGFARPVRADDDGDLAGVHGNGAAMQDIRPAIAAGHAFADQEGSGHATPSLTLFFSPVPR